MAEFRSNTLGTPLQLVVFELDNFATFEMPQAMTLIDISFESRVFADAVNRDHR
ncbi:hypothetical protein [Aliidongia dinghuensis]|uniref:hypothetical protein n=1 Tax=Aliidongia dinghuensis TaxID=1867774 RepID=UPI00166AFA5F|nr:hypothetical protein [Aliidongia dinghuensis]